MRAALVTTVLLAIVLITGCVGQQPQPSEMWTEQSPPGSHPAEPIPGGESISVWSEGSGEYLEMPSDCRQIGVMQESSGDCDWQCEYLGMLSCRHPETTSPTAIRAWYDCYCQPTAEAKLCSDECSPEGAKVCLNRTSASGGVYQWCRSNEDNDPCLEWGKYGCGYPNICVDGECIPP